MTAIEMPLVVTRLWAHPLFFLFFLSFLFGFILCFAMWVTGRQSGLALGDNGQAVFLAVYFIWSQ